ncbi:hypothetical protein PCC6912_09350 [Chlorogloeopsis fritschii PCC 6912]|uniref:Uncharacterized protein n=1 Tax=Chlorogloeopsis fritschii PCC 6912 TaxID=211165 RepID=A0A3S1A556_CHLFR|nr:hypothetical protein [Chlorogloeopsis fritschii]RUR86110.1 hypothetical protein PCC6912_09350 [Chlorogloeopsis fritschii PCC 6912]
MRSLSTFTCHKRDNGCGFGLLDAKQRRDQEAYYEFLMFAEVLQGQLLYYEKTLDKLEIPRPYFPSIRERLIQDDYDS